MNTSLPFPTRHDAGRQLAGELEEHKDAKNTYILALVRGGAEVGASLRDELRLPLYPYIVRKIGHPGHREFALGAIAEGGESFLDEKSMAAMSIEWSEIQPVLEEEMEELKRRKETYTVRPLPDLKGKTVILTDDGAATGATMFAAIADLKKQQAGKVIVALPVCAPDTAEEFRERADEAVILATPSPFNAVGCWYQHFAQVEDEEVLAILSTQE